MNNIFKILAAFKSNRERQLTAYTQVMGPRPAYNITQPSCCLIALDTLLGLVHGDAQHSSGLQSQEARFAQPREALRATLYLCHALCGYSRIVHKFSARLPSLQREFVFGRLWRAYDCDCSFFPFYFFQIWSVCGRTLFEVRKREKMSFQYTGLR